MFTAKLKNTLGIAVVILLSTASIGCDLGGNNTASNNSKSNAVAGKNTSASLSGDAASAAASSQVQAINSGLPADHVLSGADMAALQAAGVAGGADQAALGPLVH